MGGGPVCSLMHLPYNDELCIEMEIHESTVVQIKSMID